MAITIKPSGLACGAEIRGVDLCQPLNKKDIAAIRTAWLEHLVLSFPGQAMSDDDLERSTGCFGPFGNDPFLRPIPGREHIIAIRRNADETSSLFAENWHSDWSFQERPPAGTCLFGIKIPPIGGDTLFANQQKALVEMPANLRARIEGKVAIHSAAGGWRPSCQNRVSMERGRPVPLPRRPGSQSPLARDGHASQTRHRSETNRQY